jgi:predicted lipid-binding transport protein (Tim44 family)
MLRSSPMGFPPANSTPQFATADYSGGGDVCKSCKQAISGAYFRINGSLACERCTTQLQAQLPKDNHASFVRALMFGIGAAILGLIGYAAFSIITGIQIGYLSLAVGWLIGKAMRTGSRGIGGLRYQIAAALFTYAAVSMAAIPIYLSQVNKQKATQPPQVQTAPATPGASTGDSESDESASSSGTAAATAHPKPRINPFVAIGLLALLGLASPFLELQDPFHGVIGLIILFVGIRFAWQQTGAPKIDIVGPFQAARAPAPTSTT